ncbi:MAG: hypothetical protein ACI8PZ_006569 [Myxococcota bacterium]
MVGALPKAKDAAEYHDAIGAPKYGVMADPQAASLDHTPYDGQGLPGKCALSPEMEILGCTTGHQNDDLLDVIRAHAGL